MQWGASGSGFVASHTAIAGGLLTNAKAINIFQSGLPIATTDLYTVPSGRRAAFYTVSVLNPVGNIGSISWNIDVKVNGVYSLIAPVFGVQAAGLLGRQDIGLCFEAGQTIAIVLGVTANASVWANIIEYDASSPLRGIFSTNIGLGDNILYTVPAGKSSIFLGTAGVQFFPTSQSGGTSGIQLVNPTGGNINVSVFMVPSGGVAGNNNQINPPNSTVNANNRIGVPFQACLSSGGFIDVNSASAGPIVAYTNVLEYPA